MTKEWNRMTPDERRAERFERWLSPENVKFAGKTAETNYKKRVTRLIKAINCEIPDRVPLLLPSFPLYYAGMTLKEAMHDNKKTSPPTVNFSRISRKAILSPAGAPCPPGGPRFLIA